MERNVAHAEEALKVLLHHRETWTMLCDKIQEQRISGAETMVPTNHGLNGPHDWSG